MASFVQSCTEHIALPDFVPNFTRDTRFRLPFFYYLFYGRVSCNENPHMVGALKFIQSKVWESSGEFTCPWQVAPKRRERPFSAYTKLVHGGRRGGGGFQTTRTSIRVQVQFYGSLKYSSIRMEYRSEG